MSDRVSGFRTPEDAERFLRMYDELLVRYWPDVPRDELDVPTRYGTTRVRRSGTAGGTPIVLIHPTMGASVGLAPFVGRLAERGVLYTPDTLGTPGRSRQATPVRTVEDLAAWLDQTLDALELDRVHLVGYSEGGFVACLHAAFTERAERIATLTLIEPGGALGDLRKSTLAVIATGGIRLLFARDKRAAMRRMGRWLNGGTYELPDDMVDFVMLSATRFRYGIPRPKKLPDDQLRRITCPTHLMLGEDSRLYDAHALAERAGRLLPDLTTHIVAGGGHGFAYDDPDSAMDSLLAFIAAHDQSHTRG